MEIGGNFCQILELGGLLLRDGEYVKNHIVKQNK